MSVDHPHGASPASPLPAFELDGISKRYGAVIALNAAAFSARPGTVHALLGENGAGKSTLMRIAYGLERPDAGTIAVHGARVTFAGARDAIAHGIGMVHQHFTLVPVMSVAENIALGGHGMLEPSRITARVRDIAARTGFALDPEAPVESLPIGAQQRVEIAKALVRDAGVLILDEPTAVLAPAESIELLRWLRTFADAGNTVVLITHKLREALSVADDVTVLRRGTTVFSGRADATTSESLTAAMLGSDPLLSTGRTSEGPQTAQDAPTICDAQRINIVDVRGITRIRDASFVIRSGDLVGIAAVEGSGQRELLRVLAGRMHASTGTLERPERVGFIPEDRLHDAVLLERDLAENVALRGAGRRRGMVDWPAKRAETESLMQSFDVRAPSARVAMRTLSGGNQQKLVLARELRSTERNAARLIVAENPTRGLDVRATAAIHERLRSARAAGAAVVLYSSDIDEVLLLATRVLVVFSGAVHEVPLDRERIGRSMLGLA